MTPQAEQLVWHMQHKGAITSAQAYDEYGIFRTASRMHEIRKAGYKVVKVMKKGKNRFGSDCRYAEYSLLKEEEA